MKAVVAVAVAVPAVPVAVLVVPAAAAALADLVVPAAAAALVAPAAVAEDAQSPRHSRSWPTSVFEKGGIVKHSISCTPRS